MLPSLRQIRYFIAVAQSEQVSAAAVNLNVSQSAVTLAIKQLESMLNVSLFARQSTGMQLTHEGKEFLRHAQLIIREVEEAMLITQGADQLIEGELKLATTYTISGYFIPLYLAKFQRRFPKIKLTLIESHRAQIEENIISNLIDVSVMLVSNLQNQEELMYQQLLTSRRRLWVSARNPLANKESITLADVAKEPYIMLTVDEASNTAQRYWNQTTYEPNTIFRTSSVESVRSMVGHNLGVSILSDMVYRPWSLEGNKVEVRNIADPIPAMDIGLVWSRHQPQSDAAVAFCEFMIEAVSSSPLSQVEGR